MIVITLIFILMHYCKALDVIGYLPEYRHNIDFLYLPNALTHLILFSLEISPNDGSILHKERLPDLKVLNAWRGTDMQVLICFGGWGRSEGFPEITSNSKLSSRFFSNLRSFLLDFPVDGIDLNWEHPNSYDQWKSYELFISQLRSNFPSITITMSFSPNQIVIFQHLDLLSNVDMAHAMVYDGRGEHSTIDMAKQFISQWKTAGLPPSKVNLGVPFYGRDVNTFQAKTYDEIIKENPDIAENIDNVGSFYMNSQSTISEKLQLANDENLNGLMIWELGQDTSFDDPRSLLRTIRSILHKKENKDEL